MKKIDYTLIDCVEIDDIDTSDYPDFSDAFISYAEYNGVPMTDEELDELNEDSSFVYDRIIAELF
jgi:hypothetical protein